MKQNAIAAICTKYNLTLYKKQLLIIIIVCLNISFLIS